MAHNVTQNTLNLVTIMPSHLQKSMIFCNVTLGFATIMPWHKINASGKIVTRILVYFEILEKIH